MRRILLHGRDHTRLGEVAVEQAGGIGAALGRGRHPKAYPHVEPNEDSLVVATKGSFHLMAVADGHNGSLASQLAIEAIHDATSDLADLTTREAVVAACQVAQTALHSIGAPADAPPPATTLTVAILNGRDGAVGGWGDSAAVRCSGRRSHVLTESRPDFLHLDGPAGSAPRVAEFRAKKGDWLVVTSDGLVDFLTRPWEKTLAALLAGCSTVEEGIRAAVTAAGDGGGGDNLAICFLRIL